jgi:cytochrome c-type biogenesis protein CcmH
VSRDIFSVTPALAGVQGFARSTRREFRRVRAWIPAFAGMTMLVLGAPLFADSDMPAAPLSYTQLSDPRQEAAAQALMGTLRCLVCQGQSIADSDAELAGDMRAMVRERIQRGEQPEAIRAWLIQRYGNWISYDPPLEPATWFLWAAPVLLIAIGAFLARKRFRRHR